MADADNSPQSCLFSLRHDFPNEWAAYVKNPNASFAATIRKDYFPYFAQDTDIRKININGVKLAGSGSSAPPRTVDSVDPTTLILESKSGNKFDLSLPADLMESIGATTSDADGDAFLILDYTLGSSWSAMEESGSWVDEITEPALTPNLRDFG